MKIRGVDCSGEKLHNFEIICPARVCGRTPSVEGPEPLPKALLKSGQVNRSICAWNQKPRCSTALLGQYEVHVVNSMKGRSVFSSKILKV